MISNYKIIKYSFYFREENLGGFIGCFLLLSYKAFRSLIFRLKKRTEADESVSVLFLCPRLLQEVIALGIEYIQKNALFQADGAVRKPGRHHNGVAGFERDRFSLHRVIKAAREHVAQLCVRMGMHCAFCAGFKGNLNAHQVIIIGKNPTGGAAAQINQALAVMLCRNPFHLCLPLFC